MVSKILLGYKKALWLKKLQINHASQILTNNCQILVLSLLSNYYCTYVSLPALDQIIFCYSILTLELFK